MQHASKNVKFMPKCINTSNRPINSVSTTHKKYELRLPRLAAYLASGIL